MLGFYIRFSAGHFLVLTIQIDNKYDRLVMLIINKRVDHFEKFNFFIRLKVIITFDSQTDEKIKC